MKWGNANCKHQYDIHGYLTARLLHSARTGSLCSKRPSHFLLRCSAVAQDSRTTRALCLACEASKVTTKDVPGFGLTTPAARSAASVRNTSGRPGSSGQAKPKPLALSKNLTRESSVSGTSPVNVCPKSYVIHWQRAATQGRPQNTRITETQQNPLC